MKKHFKITGILAATAALALAGGCSSGANANTACVGEWTMVSLGEEVTAEEMAMLEELGMSLDLTITEDGAVTLAMLDQSQEGTWEPASGGCSIIFADQPPAEAKVTDGQLIMEQDGNQIIFTK